jgi:hypothetical protein
MSRNHCDTLWFITASDLPFIKKALEVILGDVAGPSIRLEVFSRMAGYRTYAGLKTRLESFKDVNGEPFPLQLLDAPVDDESFYEQLEPDLRRRMAEVEETGLVRLVLAALAQARHPILGDLGIPEDATIASFRKSAQHIFHPSNEGRGSAKTKGANLSALVLTPANTGKLRGNASFCVFQCAFSSPEEIPMDASTADFMTTSNPERLAEALQGREVYAYDTNDIFAISEKLKGTTAGKPAGYTQLKNITAHVLGSHSETDFQTMAEAFDCQPIGSSSRSPEQQCMEWLIDMLLLVESYREISQSDMARSA